MTKVAASSPEITVKRIKYYILSVLGVGGNLQTILASGVTLSLFAASAVISTRAAAPSLSVLALAAVTVPEDGYFRHGSFESEQRLALFFRL